MGFHVCEFCKGRTNSNLTAHTSSGDNKIETKDMIIWFPDMVIHYVVDHEWKPPDFFIEIIMKNDPQEIARERVQYRNRPASEKRVEKVGYLTGSFPTGKVPRKFKQRLIMLLQACEKSGNRLQTKGF